MLAATVDEDGFIARQFDKCGVSLANGDEVDLKLRCLEVVGDCPGEEKDTEDEQRQD